MQLGTYREGDRRACGCGPSQGDASPCFGKIPQLADLEIGNRPEHHPVLGPVHDIVALALCRVRRSRGIVFGRPDEEVDDVLVALIDERGDRAPGQVVEPATPQWKTLERRNPSPAGEVEAAVEPGLYRVPVARCDVFQMTGLHRADMAGDDLFGEAWLLGDARVG